MLSTHVKWQRWRQKRCRFALWRICVLIKHTQGVTGLTIKRNMRKFEIMSQSYLKIFEYSCKFIYYFHSNIFIAKLQLILQIFRSLLYRHGVCFLKSSRREFSPNIGLICISTWNPCTGNLQLVVAHTHTYTAATGNKQHSQDVNRTGAHAQRSRSRSRCS